MPSIVASLTEKPGWHADRGRTASRQGRGYRRPAGRRQLARAAKLAGAPRDPAAGATMHVRLHDKVVLGQPLFTLHAQSRGALQYASSFVQSQLPVVHIDAEQSP